MASRRRIGQKLVECRKNHAPIFYTGSECPACRNRFAGLEIYKEYLNMANLCSALLGKLSGG